MLLEERARTFEDALDKLFEDQSAAEYVEFFEALEKLLANYHTTIRMIPAARAALALATSETPASRCSRCGSQSVTVTVTQATRRDEPAAFKLDYDHWQPLQ